MNRYKILFASVLAALPASALPAQQVGLVESKPKKIKNPPAVQLLVPGFTVRELPLDLKNINNLVYAPDGRLFALAYNGIIYQLKDSDGDGLEDTATLFFANKPEEILPSIGMCWGPGGLYIASRGRVIRVKDKGDGTGELETIQKGWVGPTGMAGSSLDAIGIAVDPQGNVFFGLGCDNWHEAYRVNKDTGKSDYDIHSERGTIIKLSPDFKTREAICTGLRFTVSLAFNASGDLFATDQEGATWLPNGNPFDELLHIQPRRHYGFPPRHPKYLPNVIDEPSVFDYAPQHQSTCGLHFNERVAGGTSVFGPAWWEGDAFVSGESRGKIWRTKLVKSASGYVAQNELLACLNMLTVDASPTPQGDLLVTCHTGQPDWGTGPEGNGKLFKISYTDRHAPQPVFAYAASPTETRVVFDRPLDPAKLKNLAKQSSIRMGRYVSAGDRFESFVPGYQAVKDQEAVPQFDLPVLSAAVSADRRSIVLQTTTHKEAVNYAVTLPESSNAERPHDASRHELAQISKVDVQSDLTGVEVDWQAARSKEKWTGWIPHLDLGVARGFTRASEEHKHLFELLKKSGKLTLRSQLDLGLMLHPKIQPGAKLDYEYPPESVTIVFKSDAKFNLKSNSNFKIRKLSDRELQITTTPKADEWIPIELNLVTGDCEPKLDVSWFTAEDARPRPLQQHRMLMPWAKPYTEQLQPVAERRIQRLLAEIGSGERRCFLEIKRLVLSVINLQVKVERLDRTFQIYLSAIMHRFTRTSPNQAQRSIRITLLTTSS